MLLPMNGNVMDLSEVEKAAPDLRKKKGSFLNLRETYAVRQGGAPKQFHPRTVSELVDPNTGARYQRLESYAVPEGSKLPDELLPYMQHAYDRVLGRGTGEMMKLPGVMEMAAALAAREMIDGRPKTVGDFKGEDLDNLIYNATTSVIDQVHARHFPSASIVGDWKMISPGVEKPPQTQGWWSSMGGAFQNASMGAVNGLLPFQLYPGMDSEKALTKAYGTFQHLGSATPDHPSTLAASKRIVSLARPGNRRPMKPWEIDKENHLLNSNESTTDLQSNAEAEAARMIGLAIDNHQKFRSSDGSEVEWGLLQWDDRERIAHEYLRTTMSRAIGQEQKDLEGYRKFRDANARPTRNEVSGGEDENLLEEIARGAGNLGTKSVRGIVGFVPTAVQMGLAGEAAAASKAPAVIKTMASFIPFAADEVSRGREIPAQIVEQMGDSPLARLYALDRLKDASAAGKDVSYDQIVDDERNRGLLRGAGTIASAPVIHYLGAPVRNAIGNFGQSLAVKAGWRPVLGGVATPAVESATPKFGFNPSWWTTRVTPAASTVPSGALSWSSNGLEKVMATGGRYGADALANAATMSLLPVIPNLAEGKGTTPQEMLNMAEVGLMFTPYNMAMSKSFQLKSNLKPGTAPSGVTYDPWGFDSYIYPKQPIPDPVISVPGPPFTQVNRINVPMTGWADQQSARVMGPELREILINMFRPPVQAPKPGKQGPTLGTPPPPVQPVPGLGG